MYILLCVFFGLTNQVGNYFEFLCKTYFVFKNLNGECLKIFILGKLGLKLVFWKSISSHTHAFYSLCSMFWGVFQKPSYFFKNSVFPKFQLIQSVFQSIEIAFKILCEPLFVSINRNWFSINRKSWISFFLKSQILTYSNLTFQKFLNFSLSLRFELGSTSNFCRFPPKFLQGFSSLQVGMSILPYLFHLFSILHAFFHALKGYFQTMHKLGFLMYQALFVKLINGFCCYIDIFQIYDG